MCVVVLQEMQHARRRRRKDYDVTTNDDEIMAMIDKMRQAANVRLPTTVCQLNIFSCRKISN